MDVNKNMYKRMEIRPCKKHSDPIYAVACKKCNQVICKKCVTLNLESCSNGSPHTFIDLQKLVDHFVKLINDMKLWILDKEECLRGLANQLTKILSDWDNDTEEMITKLHNARDKQIKALTVKYSELEKTLIKSRTQSKKEVTSFLDDDVGDKLNEIQKGVKRIDSRLCSQHQVDIVTGMEQTENLTNELMNIEIPQYKPSTNHVKLIEKDTAIESAIEIITSDDFTLTPPEQTRGAFVTSPVTHSQLSPLDLITPPTSMTLMREFKVSYHPESVCRHEEYTYVGCCDAVDRISADGQVQKGFLTVDQYGSSITVHDDKLYVIVGSHGEKFKIQEHELSGSPIRSRVATIGYLPIIKHRIVDGKLYLPDPNNAQIVVYSDAAESVHHIPCELDMGRTFAMATVEDKYLVVTIRNTSTVLKLDIGSGEVMWTSNYVEKPGGVVCYKNRYLLVTHGGSNTKIWILDADTGECVGELTGRQREEETSKYDMDLCGDTLIVAHYNTNLVEYYKLH